MKKNILFVLVVVSVVYAAQFGDLIGTSDVVTQTELVQYAVDPTSLQLQINTNASGIALLQGGSTTNLISTNVWTLLITNGVVKGVN